MAEKVIIAGTTPSSSLMRCYLEDDGRYEVVAYTVEKAYIGSDMFDGKKVVALEELNKLFAADEYKVLNTIGYRAMNSVRERIAKMIKFMGFKLLTYVHPTASVSSPLGEGCVVLENSSIGFRNHIGEGCMIRSGVVIPHDCKVGNFSYWAPGAVSCGNVVVGERCFIGAGAVLKNGIKVADECLIGAGVYLSEDAPEVQSVFSAPTAVKRKVKSRRIL